MAKRPKSATVQIKARLKEPLRAALESAADDHSIIARKVSASEISHSLGQERSCRGTVRKVC